MHIVALLSQRGVLNRLLGGRLTRLVDHAWQLYPVGILFGLGFDTASEIGLLAIAASASSGPVPMAAVISLPLLFAAGMSAADTTDGVLLCKAYRWAAIDPSRKILCNLVTTALLVAMAVTVEVVELAQAGIRLFAIDGPLAKRVNEVAFSGLGVWITLAILAIWAASHLALGRRPLRYSSSAGDLATKLWGPFMTPEAAAASFKRFGTTELHDSQWSIRCQGHFPQRTKYPTR